MQALWLLETSECTVRFSFPCSCRLSVLGEAMISALWQTICAYEMTVKGFDKPNTAWRPYQRGRFYFFARLTNLKSVISLANYLWSWSVYDRNCRSALISSFNHCISSTKRIKESRWKCPVRAKFKGTRVSCFSECFCCETSTVVDSLETTEYLTYTTARNYRDFTSSSLNGLRSSGYYMYHHV